MTGKQQGDWMLRVEGFEPLPPAQPDLAGQRPAVYDTRGMLTEIMNLPEWRKAGIDVLDDQIQSNYRWRQLSAAVNEAANEVRFKHITEAEQ